VPFLERTIYADDDMTLAGGHDPRPNSVPVDATLGTPRAGVGGEGSPCGRRDGCCCRRSGGGDHPTTGAEAVAAGDASCLMQIGRGLSGQPAAPLDAIGGLRAQLRTTAIALHAAAHAGNP
jgi:hypothetical protein